MDKKIFIHCSPVTQLSASGRSNQHNRNMERWLDQVAVVTGASSGIGAAVAKKLVESGINVVGLARRVERIEELSNELVDQPAKLHPLKCDISKEEDIVEAFEWIKSNVGSVSIMINNAGLTRPTTLIDGDVQEWKNIFDVNVIGLCICTREAIKSMQENEIDGQIIHINSIAGHYVTAMPEPIMNVYPASKFAVTALAETLRQDLRHAGSKIKITSISPGIVETEFQDGFPDENIKAAVKGMPHLVPEDLADAVHYVLTTPPHVQIAELTIRPLGEMF